MSVKQALQEKEGIQVDQVREKRGRQRGAGLCRIIAGFGLIGPHLGGKNGDGVGFLFSCEGGGDGERVGPTLILQRAARQFV